MSRKRRIDAEGRQFHERRESDYMFVRQGEKLVCPLCYEAVLVMKEYNLCRHFDAKHRAKYDKFILEKKIKLFNCSRISLQKPQPKMMWQ